jgi:hypothetical protein
MDDVIRDLAKAHGHDAVPDNVIGQVKSKLSNAYIDQILDTGTEPAVRPSPSASGAGGGENSGGE